MRKHPSAVLLSGGHGVASRLPEELAERFIQELGVPTLVRTPGHVNLIGEHTDYNDGFVLPAPTANGLVPARRAGNGIEPNDVAAGANPGGVSAGVGLLWAQVVDLNERGDIVGEESLNGTMHAFLLTR